MTEQEQAVAHLKQEWDKITAEMHTNTHQVDRNLRLIEHYCILRDSFMEAGFDVSEAKIYELLKGRLN